jgi:hypothetical protein
MTQLNIRDVNLKINSEIKKYEKLKKAFLKIYENETKTSKTRRENIEKISNIQETDNNNLESIYKKFIDTIKDIEDKHHKEHLDKIMNLILPVTEIYPKEAKERKKEMEDLEKTKKRTEKYEKNRNEVKNDDVQKIQSINREIANSTMDMARRAKSLEETMVKFESERVLDNQYLFLHYIHSELKYHCAALENLSKLFFEIKGMDPRENLEDFAEKYGLKNYDFRKIEIDMSQIREQKRKRNERESEEIDNVYSSVNNNSIKKSRKNNTIKTSQITNSIKDSQNNNIDDQLEEEEG